MQLYDKIKNDIKNSRLNRLELAESVGVTERTLYNISEKTAIGTVLKIIEVLGKKPSYYFELEHNSTEINYKEKYLVTLEKLQEANERLLGFTDIKKDLVKPKISKI